VTPWSQRPRRPQSHSLTEAAKRPHPHRRRLMATTSSIAMPSGARTAAATSFIFGNSCQCHCQPGRRRWRNVWRGGTQRAARAVQEGKHACACTDAPSAIPPCFPAATPPALPHLQLVEVRVGRRALPTEDAPRVLAPVGHVGHVLVLRLLGVAPRVALGRRPEKDLHGKARDQKLKARAVSEHRRARGPQRRPKDPSGCQRVWPEGGPRVV